MDHFHIPLTYGINIYIVETAAVIPYIEEEEKNGSCDTNSSVCYVAGRRISKGWFKCIISPCLRKFKQ
jgi:hypothetical protein